MPFRKGQVKTAGRQKGSKNKTSDKVREVIEKFAQGISVKELITAWDSIKDPSRKLDAYFKLTKFIVPELKSIEQNIQIEDVVMTIKHTGGKVIVEDNGD